MKNFSANFSKQLRTLGTFKIMSAYTFLSNWSILLYVKSSLYFLFVSKTIAAILLADFGHDKKEAIDLVRERRKGAIETKAQEDFIFSYQVIK